MSLNVSGIKSPLFASPVYASANKVDGKNFVKNAYAVQGNLTHPESRTNYDNTDYRGKNVYFLA